MPDEPTNDLMLAAIEQIDAKYGKHFAVNHLELVHALMVCATLDRLINVATRALDLLEADRTGGTE